MMKRCYPTISAVIIGGAAIAGSSDLAAHRLGVEYTTELQTDFAGGYDWLNLLKTSAELNLWKGLSIEASTISASETSGVALVNDLLTYSNIAAGNIPLSISRLGFGLATGDIVLFAGINNVNEEYFTTDLTSFFTNSSCGISPTISCNYDIANYPMAAWCVHYRQQAGDLAWQTSLYPGRGYYRILGHDNLFSLDLKRDGIFSISSLEYNRNGIYTTLGVALHYGVCIGDVPGVQEITAPSTGKKSFTASPWLLSEISLPGGLGFLLHGSLSTIESGCKGYIGVGSLYKGWRVEPGVSFNFASFTDAKEYDLELTARIPVFSDKATIQPALHLIGTEGSALKCVGMLRFLIGIESAQKR